MSPADALEHLRGTVDLDSDGLGSDDWAALQAAVRALELQVAICSALADSPLSAIREAAGWFAMDAAKHTSMISHYTALTEAYRDYEPLIAHKRHAALRSSLASIVLFATARLLEQAGEVGEVTRDVT